MTQIRSIAPHESARFAAAGEPSRPERIESVLRYVEQMVAGGAMRPEWCFLAEDGNRAIGRIGFWTLPGQDAPLDIVLFDAPWAGDWRTTGDRLLAEAVARARTLGATHLGHVLDDPPAAPQWQEHAAARVALLEDAGFALERATDRFARGGDAVPPGSARLAFRGFAETGDEAVVGALAAIATGSLDQRDRDEVARRGADGAARSLLADLRRMDHDPSWWELAYDAAGELVGLVMPARTPTSATIGYIGVVPAQRGHGYVDDLLARGTATLLAAGATALHADTDQRNRPMAAAFRRAGWTPSGTRREYGIELS